jgi:hypothetical protein
MGDINSTMTNEPEQTRPDQPDSPAKSIPILAKTEQNRARKLDHDIIEDCNEIQKRFKRLAKNLTEMHERRLYFAFGFFTFEEYCRKRLAKSRQYVYKIMQAYDTLKFLADQGVSEEDTDALTERLAREIRALPQYKQAKVAKAIARIKREQGRTATVLEIQAEADRLDHEPDSARNAREQTEVLTKLEKMARGLKMGLSFDTLSDDYRRRITVALMSIADGVKVLLAAINSPEVRRRAQANKPEPDK